MSRSAGRGAKPSVSQNTETRSPPATDSTGSWEFWIDVGGTFTDCLARRQDGKLLRHKLLSSGVTKGIARRGDSADTWIDSARCGDPPGMWAGYEFRLLDPAGEILHRATVKQFDQASGSLILEPAPTRSPIWTRPDELAYELASAEPAPLIAIRYLLGIGLHDLIPPASVRLGTTRGTNALLTRSGAPTALVTTQGFGDILQIGDQDRPRLFDLDIVKRKPLYREVVEIRERMTCDGQVLIKPDKERIHQQLLSLKKRGIESLAICLLNAYAHPQHEQVVAAVAAELGFDEISASHVSAPLIKLVARGDTTVVDAYLTPVLREYVALLRAKLAGSELRLMTSAGGLVAAESFSGKDCILSGPAGGVVGFARAAEALELPSGSTGVRAIGFDMGGTSTDVARYEGTFRRQYEAQKAGVRIVAPMMAIETVAAGGGSCCDFDGVKLTVGPESAGADPGPACYGRGGPLTVTDINLTLGKILPAHFPFPLDEQATRRRLAELGERIEQATGKRYSPVELADGFLRVANTNMIEAIRSISIAEGVDPREYMLVAFGGAAGQHACAVAKELGIRQVLLHPDAGILSARGIGLADITRHAAEGIYRHFDANLANELAAVFSRLIETAREQLLGEGVDSRHIEVRRFIDLRYQGLDRYLTIPCTATIAEDDLTAGYEREHQRLYGYCHTDRALEVVAVRVELLARRSAAAATSRPSAASHPCSSMEATVYIAARPQAAQVYLRSELRPGDIIEGPALVLEDNSTIVIDPSWRGEVYSEGELVLNDLQAADEGQEATADETVSTESDPVMLEIFNNQFAAIARQMGITLQNTATSVNVKERLDFSCAIFTPVGDLVVNAPHIPVHLGAMSETVRRCLADNPRMSPGDVFVTNDPYRGGSHLPDITVVTPMFDEAGKRVLFFTASRAHHAEIGGIDPGSMPPASKNLAEEGVLIRNFKLIDAGQPRFESLREVLSAPPYPSRAVNDNLADLAAQVAANNQGAQDLRRLIGRYSLKVVQAYTEHIQRAAETKMRSALARLPDGRREFVDYLDYLDSAGGTQSAVIQVAIVVQGDQAEIDFVGTSPVLPNNFNANRAIVTAAVMYVMRCLIDEDIPLNEGVLAPVSLKLPRCFLNPQERENAADSPAVVGGNVETSQRVVDVLLGALGVAAASQGTMNNVLFGDQRFGYYETICGGSGATANAPGVDAVHTHMTNTRLTDAEILEHNYPVRLRSFSIRRGSGGPGRMTGGDGVIRQLEFLRELQVSVLSTRRGPHPPYGVEGAQSGALGRNLLLRRADGEQQVLPAQTDFVVSAGDLLVIETPGGGGYGSLDDDEPCNGPPNGPSK